MTDKTSALEALKLCRDQFAFYADEHRKAGKNDKAATNERFRDLCDAALQPVSAEPVAWRCPQPSKTHPWAFTWDIDTVRMWEELLPENGPVQPLYLSLPSQSARIRELEVLKSAMRRIFALSSNVRPKGYEAVIVNIEKISESALNKESDPS